MTASVDILTGEKTVLQYLLKPILKAQQNASARTLRNFAKTADFWKRPNRMRLVMRSTAVSIRQGTGFPLNFQFHVAEGGRVR